MSNREPTMKRFIELHWVTENLRRKGLPLSLWSSGSPRGTEPGTFGTKSMRYLPLTTEPRMSPRGLRATFWTTTVGSEVRWTWMR